LNQERLILWDEVEKTMTISDHLEWCSVTVKLPAEVRMQSQKLCAWNPSNLSWYVLHANEVYIFLAILGFDWFFACWMQGFMKKMSN
jgi:hypothetical protein